jgi:hypothetical protein
MLLWSSLRYYPGIYLERLRKSTENRGQDIRFPRRFESRTSRIWSSANQSTVTFIFVLVNVQRQDMVPSTVWKSAVSDVNFDARGRSKFLVPFLVQDDNFPRSLSYWIGKWRLPSTSTGSRVKVVNRRVCWYAFNYFYNRDTGQNRVTYRYGILRRPDTVLCIVWSMGYQPMASRTNASQVCLLCTPRNTPFSWKIVTA